jgi:DNA modification methylase
MVPYYQDETVMLYNGNALEVLKELPERSAWCCVTSPPYWGLRDYGIPPSTWPDGWVGCHGLEPEIEMYVEHEVMIFRELRRVLHNEGTLWLNLGDTYMGSWGGYCCNTPGGQREKHAEKFDREYFKIKDHPRPPSSFVKNSFRRDRAPREDDPHKSAPGLKAKDMAGIPWRVAFALQADGWYLRCDIIWHKPNPMPESVRDRPTKSHEYLFLLAKSEVYHYDFEAIKEDAKTDSHKKPAKRGEFNGKTEAIEGRNSFRALQEKRNKRSVWTVPTLGFPDAHFATFPPDLIKPCIIAGCPKGKTVIDPFSGSGTTSHVAKELGRKAIAIDLNPGYLEMNKNRIVQEVLPL